MKKKTNLVTFVQYPTGAWKQNAVFHPRIILGCVSRETSKHPVAVSLITSTLMFQLNEICEWLTKSAGRLPGAGEPNQQGCSKPWALTELRAHQAAGEPLIARIASADAKSSLDSGVYTATSQRIVGSRLLRGHSSSSTAAVTAAATEEAATKPRPNVVATARPLIRQLRARLHTAIGIVSQSLVDVDSFLPGLCECAQNLQ